MNKADRFHYDIEQGEPEWDDIRRGKVTASKIKDVMAKGKGATRRTYLGRIVAERMSGTTQSTFSSSEMQWGMENEPAARDLYEFITGNEVVEIGFVDHAKIEMCGCSPDGLVGDDGMMQIKCLNSANHQDYLIEGNFPEEFVKQMQTEIFCADRSWSDLFLYDPRMNQELQWFLMRLERDEEIIKEIEEEILSFQKDASDKQHSLEIIQKRRMEE